MFLIPAFILVVGVINSYNFMDGINGIHVMYSIVVLGTLYYLSETYYSIMPSDVFIGLFASLVVFAFFNLRKKAKCFSGDVGSVSIAFIISFLIIQLIIRTEDFRWILLLGVYGIDSVATIVLRLKRRENIFVAHRSHFYQYLANDRKMSHVMISIYYALVQLFLNLILLFGSNYIVIGTLLFMISIYVYLRLALEGKSRLFVKY
jgi:UDP-N-acetylmuramyl pentapeptide phosphotransferase/UDP-N-acetylglucosamine-1-phosphate transferase